jgi:hypothetical protein
MYDQQLSSFTDSSIMNVSINFSHPSSEEDMYYVTPPIPDIVFTISIGFLVITGTFGILANLSIFCLFFRTPAVSIQ